LPTRTRHPAARRLPFRNRPRADGFPGRCHATWRERSATPFGQLTTPGGATPTSPDAPGDVASLLISVAGPVGRPGICEILHRGSLARWPRPRASGPAAGSCAIMSLAPPCQDGRYRSRQVAETWGRCRPAAAAHPTKSQPGPFGRAR
jgi:hypothetical protein